MSAARDETGCRLPAVAPGAAGWLGLAAAPTFAAMALLTYAPDGGTDMICSAIHGGSPFGGMAPMYVLMSASHLAPWLKLIARLRGADRGSSQMGLHRAC